MVLARDFQQGWVGSSVCIDSMAYPLSNLDAELAFSHKIREAIYAHVD
jgi:hypothetical protein